MTQQSQPSSPAPVAPIDPGTVATITVMTEGGYQRIAPDSTQGQLYRPTLAGREGARTATLETLFDFWIDNVPDPDFALQQDPQFFERMRQQPDVHAAMRKREVTVASLPLNWKASAEKGVDPAEAQLMADYMQDRWKSLPNVTDLYRGMQAAVLQGGIGYEFVWERDSEGISRPVAYQQVSKTRFVFDRLGNMSLLTRNQPVWGAYVAPSVTRVFDDYKAFPTPPGKFLYHKYMADGGTWQMPAGEGYLYYGRGEDSNLYYIVKFDQFVLRFRLKWLEKHGMPLTVLYYPEGAVSQSQVQQVCNSIRDEAIAVVPHPPGTPPENWFSLDFVTPPSIGHDAFATFSREWTAPAVEKILLGGADQMSLGDVGGYSATINQRDAGESILFRYDAMNIDETINTQVTPYCIRAVPRWANVPLGHMPRHCLAPDKVKDRMQELEILEKMATMVPVKEDAVYEAGGQQRPKDGLDGSTPERSIFLGQAPAIDPWGGMDPGPGQKDAMRDPDRRGVEQLEDPRSSQMAGKGGRLMQVMQNQMKVAMGALAQASGAGQGGRQGGQQGGKNGRVQRLNGSKNKKGK